MDEKFIRKYGIDKSKLIDEGIADLCMTCENTACSLRGIATINLHVSECEQWVHELPEDDNGR